MTMVAYRCARRGAISSTPSTIGVGAGGIGSAISTRNTVDLETGTPSSASTAAPARPAKALDPASAALQRPSARGLYTGY